MVSGSSVKMQPECKDINSMQVMELQITWFDGGVAADVDPTTGNWVHLAFAIGTTEARVYIDGVEVNQGAFDGIDWTGCDLLSIMSGSPRFNGWNHKSDESQMDELYLFDKALSEEEVILLRNDGL